MDDLPLAAEGCVVGALCELALRPARNALGGHAAMDQRRRDVGHGDHRGSYRKARSGRAQADLRRTTRAAARGFKPTIARFESGWPRAAAPVTIWSGARSDHGDGRHRAAAPLRRGRRRACRRDLRRRPRRLFPADVCATVSQAYDVPRALVHHGLYGRGTPRDGGTVPTSDTSGAIAWVEVALVDPAGQEDVYDVVTGDDAQAFPGRRRLRAQLRQRDGAPAAYKRLDAVLAARGETIEILHRLTPIGVAIAAADTVDPYKDRGHAARGPRAFPPDVSAALQRRLSFVSSTPHRPLEGRWAAPTEE